MWFTNSSKRCLNGWWDFQPGKKGETEDVIPGDGWSEESFLVPGIWNKSLWGIRAKGEPYFSRHPEFKNPEFDFTFDMEQEFLFDAYDYPLEWSSAKSWWIRRNLTIKDLPKNTRLFLLLEAVSPRMSLFINGKKVGDNVFPHLPSQVDITDAVKVGDNEIVVRARDYDRDEQGRSTSPVGSWIPTSLYGIWQDTWLIERSDVYLGDITIRPSVRTSTVELIFSVTNASNADRTVKLSPDIICWSKDVDIDSAKAVFDIPTIQLTIAPSATGEVALNVSAEGLEMWQPENPKLYLVRTKLADASSGQILETHCERFGYREVWIEGKDLILNGYPLHLFSDWGHKAAPYCLDPHWVQKWFDMIRDGNMNHSRLHTSPHPPFILDMADEQGILITCEGLHGSGNGNAVDEPVFWENAAEAARLFVQRDKNHPSVILWSASNEMRWNRSEKDNVRKKLPAIGEIYRRLDPTRPVYFDGDSSLWDEHKQQIISRHYGSVCAGMGWWDKSRPLSSGEMAYYHLQGPNNTLSIKGDETFASYAATDEGAAIDANYVIEAGRAQGVCCLGPWNQSCNINLRKEKELVRLDYDDYTTPGVKPLRVPSHSSEFEFWKEGKGYHTQGSFEIQKHGFRPFAIIDLSNRSQYFRGRSFRRKLTLVNDTTTAQMGTLKVSLSCKGNEIGSRTFSISLDRGRQAEVEIDFDLSRQVEPGSYVYSAMFINAEEETLDAWSRQVRVAQSLISENQAVQCRARVGVYGKGLITEKLQAVGMTVLEIEVVSSGLVSTIDILVIQKHAMKPEQAFLDGLSDFVSSGGKLIVLEQLFSFSDKLEMQQKPIHTGFMRSPHHPVLNDISPEDLSFWGDDAYVLDDGNSFVATRLYAKSESANQLALVDGGTGGFGTGDLSGAALIEMGEGKGMILCSQFNLTDKLGEIPTAEKLLLNLLKYAEGWTPPAKTEVRSVDGNDASIIGDTVDSVRGGSCAVVNNITADTIEKWASTTGLALEPLEVGQIFQAVRVKPDPILNGISNEDTCGIEKWTYTRPETTNTCVGELAMKPCDGLESLLETPTESGLAELFEYGGATEALRAHTVSRFCYGDEKPAAGVILGRVRIGQGVLYINQFAPRSARTRFNRYGARLLGNLRGEIIPDIWFHAVQQNDSSSGRPRNCYVANLNPSQEVIDATEFVKDDFLGSQILNLADWRQVECAEGVCDLSVLDTSKPVAIYYIMNSPVARKNIELEDALPNPEFMTFMEIKGCGIVDVYVNARQYSTLELSDEPSLVSDISLEKGWNHVLIAWRPGSELPEKVSIKMFWRNIMGQAESVLIF